MQSLQQIPQQKASPQSHSQHPKPWWYRQLHRKQDNYKRSHRPSSRATPRCSSQGWHSYRPGCWGRSCRRDSSYSSTIRTRWWSTAPRSSGCSVRRRSRTCKYWSCTPSSLSQRSTRKHLGRERWLGRSMRDSLRRLR
uniref:Uncharacterized protein n=1 Tax=Arcella intermedia TaxID=1963864 RepID=A0A6B2LI08_9EUKA